MSNKKEKMPALAFMPVKPQLYHLRREMACPECFPRIAEMLISGMLVEPLNLWETARVKEAVEGCRVEKAPVFIVGHWRSGTTFLHNLLATNPRFGYPTLFQTLFPKSFFSFGFLKKSLSKKLPATRKIDSMSLDLDFPQEEEFAVARLTPFSYYHALSYPLEMDGFFEKYVLMEGLSERATREMKSVFVYLVKKLTLAWKGKRLVFKSPVNTARIDFVLSMFPEARFVHIRRNPLDIFESTRNTMRILAEDARFQPFPDERMAGCAVIRQYERMMDSYFRQKKNISENRLAEVAYEDLAADPEAEIERICLRLGLSFDALARKRLRSYLAGQKNYRKNRFVLTPGDRAMILKHWARTLNKWGYNQGRRTFERTGENKPEKDSL